MKGREQEEPLSQRCFPLLSVTGISSTSSTSPKSTVVTAAYRTCAHEIYTVDRQTHSEADTQAQ